MKKKWLAGLLAAVLAVSVIGCGGGSDSGSNSGSDDSSSGTTENTDGADSGEAGDSGEDSSAAGEINFDEDPYTVTLVLSGTQQQDEERIEEAMNEILLKELNAKIDIVMLPWGSADQQKQLMLSGDEAIDILNNGRSASVEFIKSGQILDMSELIEQYGTNLKEIFGMDVLMSNSIDGFVYGVPVQIERGSIPSIYLRKDIVEKYEIDTSTIKEPKDLEPIYEMLSEQEPDMNMLFSTSTGDTPMFRLWEGDAIVDWFAALMNQTEDTTVECAYMTDWYMDNAKMLYSWYEKGWINKDAATETENWRTVMKAGNCFSIFYIYHPATPVELESSTDQEFEIIHFKDNAVKNSSTYNGVILSLAQNCEDPVKSMQVLDYLYGSRELMNLLNWGQEGIDYVYADEENDIITYPDGITMDNVGYSLNLGWELPNQFISSLWEGSEPGTWQMMEEFNDSAEESLALGFGFDNTGYENLLTALNNVKEQYEGSINSGAVDPEVYIPQFIEALEKAGIQELLDAVQEQLDAWLAEK